MKKFFSSLLFMLLSVVVCSVIFVSCGDDEVEPGSSVPGNNAEQNTKDVAVTGPIKEVDALYACINGVVNLEVITASYTNIEIGVELSTTQDFKEKHRFKATDVVGRTFNVRPILLPETKYYYRTYVNISSLSYDYYGETYSFTTKKLRESMSNIAITGQVELTDRTAKISGKVTSADIKAVSANIGIEVSPFADFSYSRRISREEDADFFVLEFDGLWFDTKYYYRTFVDISPYPQKVFYGETLMFATNPLKGIDAFVDFGLPSKTLWATVNVGALNPEEYGDYFAWGETQSKSNYSESNYFDKSYKKYETEGQTEILLEDDVAYVNSGGVFRIPSKEQFDELINSSYTTTEWTTQNGVYGRKITSKMSGYGGNSLFLPAAKFRDGMPVGSYWSRTLYTANPYYACDLYFDNSIVAPDRSHRYYGYTVRPVRVFQN